MATERGMDGSVTVAGVAMAETTAWEITAPRELLQDTALGDTSQSYKLGLKDWRGRVTVHLDYLNTEQASLVDNALATSPSAIAFEFLANTGKKFVGSAYPILERTGAALSSIVDAEFTLVPAGDLTITWA